MKTEWWNSLVIVDDNVEKDSEAKISSENVNNNENFHSSPQPLLNSSLQLDPVSSSLLSLLFLTLSVFSPCSSSPFDSLGKQNSLSAPLVKSHKKCCLMNNNNEDIINSNGIFSIIRSLVRMIGIY